MKLFYKINLIQTSHAHLKNISTLDLRKLLVNPLLENLKIEIIYLSSIFKFT